MMRRRGFLAALAIGVVAPRPAQAQRGGRIYRVGYLGPGPPRAGGPFDQFRGRAKELGYVEGQNFVIETRWFEDPVKGQAMAEELVRSSVEVIIAHAPNALVAARNATRTIPVLAFYIGDPIRMGLVDTLARPGGNVTGLTWDTGVDSGYLSKTLQLLKETVPRATHVALLWNVNNDSHPAYVKDYETLASAAALHLLPIGARVAEEFEATFRQMRDARANAVIISNPLTVRTRDTLTTLRRRFRVPAVWGSAVWPLSGAVMTFGPDVRDHPRRAADYMDRILKGASPAELPFEQPTKFDLVIDLKIAQTLGLTIPPSVLLRATEVIQ